MASKVRKIVGAVLSVLLVVIVALLCVFFLWLGPTAKMVAQRIGSRALGTPLTIQELTISPRHGTLHMTGFAIANQDEFGRSNAVSLARMDIALDVTSIFSSTVVVHRVQIESPHFVYEQNAASDNITRFLKSIEAYAGVRSGEPTKDPGSAEEEAEPKAVIVEQLEINDIQFHLANTDAAHLDIDLGIEQIAVSMTNGTVTLKNLHIGNPGRLETPNLFTLDAIAVDVDPSTIYSDTLSIRDVRITKPHAYLERNPQTDTVAECMKIAESFADTRTNATPRAKTQAAAETATGQAEPLTRPAHLHNLVVDDLQLRLLDSTTTNAPSERMLAGIDSITVKLLDGRIRIQGISVPNPAGYQTANLFQLANIDIDIDPGSMFSNQVDIREVRVDSPLAALEQTATGGNVADLQEILTGFVPQAAPTSESPATETAAAATERPAPVPLDQQPVIVRSLMVTNFLITVSAPSLTNAPSGWALDAESLSQLRPLKNLPNPFGVRDAPEHAEEAQPAEGPLNLIAFSRLQLCPLDGTLNVENLSVANPRGFSNKHLVALDQFRLEILPGSLQTDTLVINEILIDRPRVAYERRITTDNIQTLQAQLEQIIKQRNKEEQRLQAEAPPSGAQGAPASADGTEPKVVIRHLLVRNGLVKAKLSVAPSAPIPLPDIERNDMGGKDGGATLTAMTSELGTLFYDAVIGCVSGATGLAGNVLKEAGSLSLGSLKKATGLSSEKPGSANTGAGELRRDETETAQPEADQAPKRPRRSWFRRRPGA